MNPSTTKRPWGSFTTFAENEKCTVKLLYVNRGEEFSLQYHNNRDEFWKIMKGNPDVTIGEKVESAHEGDEFFVEKGISHRVSAPDDDVIILEVSTGEFDEDDIVRLEDKYNRV